MSDETLRKAVSLLREEWGDHHRGGGAWLQIQKFHLAVADWLDNFTSHDEVGDYGPDEQAHAFIVARAYLGESE